MYSEKPGGPLGCGNLSDYARRTSAIATHLKGSSWWKDCSKSFLMLNSFYYVKDILAPELLKTLIEGNAIFTSSDRNYIDFLAMNDTVTPAIVPYKAHYRLEDSAWLSLDNLEYRPRTHNLMFHGSTTRGTHNNYSEGELR